jgi:hypothetical protein
MRTILFIVAICATTSLHAAADTQPSLSATLKGSLAAASAELPNVAHVRIQSAAFSDALELECPVVDRVWTCRVPAATLDARVSIDGFAPLYFWREVVATGAVRDVGPRRLERDASIIGWVELPRGHAVSPPASVQLRVRSFATGAEHADSSAISAMTTTADARGFFQFRGVPLGAYGVTANAGDATSAQMIEVDVDTPTEVSLRKPLVLVPPVPLRVQISPPLAPGAKPWRIVLRRPIAGSNLLANVTDSAAREDGSWTFAVPVADYALSLIDARGSVVHRQSLRADDLYAPIGIELPLVEVTGTVKAGTQPIKGTVAFSMRNGGSASFDANADGVFSGVLPKEGRWNVKVHPPGDRMYLSGIAVDVKKRDGESVAKVDITLPAGTLRGNVSDGRGNPIVADVQVFRDNELLGVAASNSRGEFTLFGLPEGRASVHAEADDAESAVVPVDILSDSDTSVNVIVAAARRIRGVATTRSGRPVSGALIRCTSASLLTTIETTTGASGEFTLPLPAETTRVDCVVLAGGLPITVMPLSVSRDAAPIDLVIEDTGGTLKILLSRGARPFVGRQGALVSLAMLFPPHASGPPPGFTKDGYEAQLASGAYDVCPGNVRDQTCRSVLVAPMSYAVADVSPAAVKP